MISVSSDKDKLDIPFILSELKQVSWLAPKTLEEVQNLKLLTGPTKL